MIRFYSREHLPIQVCCQWQRPLISRGSPELCQAMGMKKDEEILKLKRLFSDRENHILGLGITYLPKELPRFRPTGASLGEFLRQAYGEERQFFADQSGISLVPADQALGLMLECPVHTQLLCLYQQGADRGSRGRWRCVQQLFLFPDRCSLEWGAEPQLE